MASSKAPQNSILRYSRLQICATFRTWPFAKIGSSTAVTMRGRAVRFRRMLDPRRNEPSAQVPAQSGSSTPLPDADVCEPTEPKLSKEEQMALYEDYLKENDWGHQPC